MPFQGPAWEFEGAASQPLHDLAACERLGIWNLENLAFTQLLEDKVYEFLFVWSPLKIKGGTGSPGNPIAIY